MIMAQEGELLKAEKAFRETMEMIRQASQEGRVIHEVELDLWKRALAVNLAFLNAFVLGHGRGDVGPTLEWDGRELRRLEELHERRYVSIFGEMMISRTVYGTRETQKHELVPLDAALGLPEGEFSYLLQDWDQSLCVQESYAKSRDTIQKILGIGQSVRSLEHMSLAMARSVTAYQVSQPAPPAEEEGAILVLTADGKGVPMRREDSPASQPQQKRRKKGEKANKKRQACVGAVYTVEPFVRTPAEVVNEVMREERRPDRPLPQHKQVRGELSRFVDGEEVNGKDLIFSWFAQQVRARNRDRSKPVVCLTDGDRALQNMVVERFPKVTLILDLYHAMERLWSVGHCFYPEGSPEAEEFVTERLERILQGQVARVIGGCRQMATKRELSRWRRTQLEAALSYLESNRPFMRYDEYLAAGYPIGSGVVEGACRHLVKDRMELTGMRWRIGGAQAMLDLRAIFINGEWERFQRHRIDAEQRKLYPDRQSILSLGAAA